MYKTQVCEGVLPLTGGIIWRTIREDESCPTLERRLCRSAAIRVLDPDGKVIHFDS